MKYRDMEQNISVFNIKGETFIKIISLDMTTSAMNVDIYYKVNNRYRTITQAELPKEIVNYIATKESEPISEEEFKNFNKFIEKTSLSEANTPIDNVQTIFGKTLYTNYILTKSKDQNYYILQNAIVNEFGMLLSTTPVVSAILPYVFASVIDKGNKFKKQVFLVSENVFVQTCEVNDQVLGIMYQFEENEDKDNAKIIVIGLFAIAKNFNGEYIIKTTPEQLKDIKHINKIIDEQIVTFMKKLELQKTSL